MSGKETTTPKGATLEELQEGVDLPDEVVDEVDPIELFGARMPIGKKAKAAEGDLPQSLHNGD